MICLCFALGILGYLPLTSALLRIDFTTTLKVNPFLPSMGNKQSKVDSRQAPLTHPHPLLKASAFPRGPPASEPAAEPAPTSSIEPPATSASIPEPSPTSRLESPATSASVPTVPKFYKKKFFEYSIRITKTPGIQTSTAPKQPIKRSRKVNSNPPEEVTPVTLSQNPSASKTKAKARRGKGKAGSKKPFRASPRRPFKPVGVPPHVGTPRKQSSITKSFLVQNAATPTATEAPPPESPSATVQNTAAAPGSPVPKFPLVTVQNAATAPESLPPESPPVRVQNPATWTATEAPPASPPVIHSPQAGTRQTDIGMDIEIDTEISMDIDIETQFDDNNLDSDGSYKVGRKRKRRAFSANRSSKSKKTSRKQAQKASPNKNSDTLQASSDPPNKFNTRSKAK